jgi:hypothetical protein
MSGLILLFIIVLWVMAVKGMTAFFTKAMPANGLTKILKVLLFSLIFMLPVIDEIAGAVIFQSKCADLPPVKFYGAASIGEGYFFDGAGNPKINFNDRFWAMNNSEKFNQVVDELTTKQTVKKFPVLIELKTTQYFSVNSHKLIFETQSLYSRGGWISRLLDGFHNYSCGGAGAWPKEQSWIKF